MGLFNAADLVPGPRAMPTVDPVDLVAGWPVFDEITKPELGDTHQVGFQALAKELASNARTGEVYARWLVADLIRDWSLHPVGLAHGVCRWFVGIHMPMQYQIVVSDH